MTNGESGEIAWRTIAVVNRLSCEIAREDERDDRQKNKWPAPSFLEDEGDDK